MMATTVEISAAESELANGYTQDTLKKITLQKITKFGRSFSSFSSMLDYTAQIERVSGT